MKATELARMLGQQMEGFVRELLPNGKRQGPEWVIGGTDGEKGRSMGVVVAGERSGQWLDRASGEKGDAIGLLMAVRGYSLVEACKEAKAFLNIRDEMPKPPAKVWKKPSKEGVSSLSPEHSAWLRDVRKLPDESVAAYKIATRGKRIMFPYLRDGELIFAKYRELPKEFLSDGGCEPILFGWQAISPTARAVTIVEGELDAIAMHAYGFPAMSVPTGAVGHAWLEREFDRLAIFDTIYLALDDDKDGRAGTAELVERLGRERVKVVQLPRKDANDCLMAGIQPSEIIQCLRDAKTQDPAELRNVGEFEDAMLAEYSKVDTGLELPWKKTHGTIRLREGELSVWAGINGHGKSILLSQIFGYLAVRDVRCCVASMEYRTPKWLMRMNRQIAGVELPSESFARSIHRELARNMYAFHVAGSAKADRILAVFSYARRRYGTELFLLDNLTKAGFADDDYPGQKKFIETLSDFARDTGTHVAVVAHMKKGESEDRPGGKFAVKGSGGIIDMADTSAEIWRNKPRERALAFHALALSDALKNGGDAPVLDEKWEKQPDAMIIFNKQRENGEEPTVNLWYDKTTTQFLSGPDHKPMCLLPRSALSLSSAVA